MLTVEPQVHNTVADADTIRCGLRGSVRAVPEGFRLSTIMVGGQGVTDTVREWGRLMLKSYGKGAAEEVLRTAYDTDPSLRYLSYWTDAGAAYYYETENATTSYEQTMIDAKQWMIQNGVPTVGYQAQHPTRLPELDLCFLQFDSW